MPTPPAVEIYGFIKVLLRDHGGWGAVRTLFLLHFLGWGLVGLGWVNKTLLFNWKGRLCFFFPQWFSSVEHGWNISNIFFVSFHFKGNFPLNHDYGRVNTPMKFNGPLNMDGWKTTFFLFRGQLKYTPWQLTCFFFNSKVGILAPRYELLNKKHGLDRVICKWEYRGPTLKANDGWLTPTAIDSKVPWLVGDMGHFPVCYLGA